MNDELLELVKECERLKKKLGRFLILGGIVTVILTVAAIKFLPW